MTRSDQWANRMEIKSESSSRVYVVAQRVSTGLWECSCPGWKSRRKCKHLAAMKLETQAPINPAPKGWGEGDNYTFTDAAYEHYDPYRDGFGNWHEWARLADEWAHGRRYHREREQPQQSFFDRKMADLKLLGLDAAPENAKDLVRAMRKMAMKLHPDHGGDPEAFRDMYAAFERLQRMY